MLGALLIVGSEQSVLTMVLITIHRLHAVLRFELIEWCSQMMVAILNIEILLRMVRLRKLAKALVVIE